MQNKNFDSELEDLLIGISKIKEFSDSSLSGTHAENLNDESANVTFGKTANHLNLTEVTRQSMRPEAAVWLGFAALISASNQHSDYTRKLASKLGGHLARRRARPLGTKFKTFPEVTISPRCRKLVGSLNELGSEITEVFGVWLKMKSNLTADEVKKTSGCMWPAINCIEKDVETTILIPRFPERMPLVLCENNEMGKYVKISEEGKLSFVFWMDEGIDELEHICGVAWLEQGLFPLIYEN